MAKTKTSFTLTNEAKRLLELLAKQLGISQSNLLELMIREKAESKGVKLESVQDRTRSEQ
ncbi:MAG: ribbon-helix-helix protein, CopG family [Caldilineaceae bacterium]